ncbi:MAG TPA: imidazole glycerol phosphate synthase subunit HisH [Steroidobacteraceae bacterium]|nr:imidazole glycerol phosphate synthase subunit HisH [Steroidobacteraceae bacterium]
MSAPLAIIDSGGANIASLRAALSRLGTDSVVTSDPGVIQRATRVLLPGVGSAHNAMARLRSTGLDKLIPTLKQPLLGICLGMQILFDASEEGPANGLAVIPGNVERLQFAPGLPVPHMGWNQLNQTKPDPLLDGVGSLDYVYFVHGYAVPAGTWTVATTDYGSSFTAVARRDNFCGTQFHPERSGVVGARILANFLKAQA